MYLRDLRVPFFYAENFNNYKNKKIATYPRVRKKIGNEIYNLEYKTIIVPNKKYKLSI